MAPIFNTTNRFQLFIQVCCNRIDVCVCIHFCMFFQVHDTVGSLNTECWRDKIPWKRLRISLWITPKDVCARECWGKGGLRVGSLIDWLIDGLGAVGVQTPVGTKHHCKAWCSTSLLIQLQAWLFWLDIRCISPFTRGICSELCLRKRVSNLRLSFDRSFLWGLNI